MMGMKKPIPYIESHTVMDFIAMQHWIDEKYNITARDYAGRHAGSPKWTDSVIDQGISPDRAVELYKTKPEDITDPSEKLAAETASKIIKDHMENTPYWDFWHFQLKLFDNFLNDSYQIFPLGYQMDACKEDWQREIAQMWLNEFGEFQDPDGNIRVWVSW